MAMYAPHRLEASSTLEVPFVVRRAVEARDLVFAAYANLLAKQAARRKVHLPPGVGAAMTAATMVARARTIQGNCFATDLPMARWV
jgi:hypothetical protein